MYSRHCTLKKSIILPVQTTDTVKSFHLYFLQNEYKLLNTIVTHAHARKFGEICGWVWGSGIAAAVLCHLAIWSTRPSGLNMDVVVLLLLTIFSVKGQMTSSDDDEECPPTTLELSLDLSRSLVTASSTCGDDNFKQYCYVNSTDQTMQCRTCEHEEEARASNVVDSDPNSHWISRPGLEAVNLTVDLIQVLTVNIKLEYM